MYSLNTNNNNINNLNIYMLNSIKNNNETNDNLSDNLNDNKKINENKINIPKSSIYINYNKLKSKYNEKTFLSKKLNLNDKLFWCFYKLYKNINDNDLEYINTFTTEKEFKVSVIEKIKNLDNYNVIKLIYKNSSSINNNFELVNNIDKTEVINALNNFYYVKNLDKPLKSLSSYKLDEIIEIANKLCIDINNEFGKKKTKNQLYSDCVKKIS